MPIKDDTSAPAETRIYYSKTKNYSQMVMALIFAIGGFVIFSRGEFLWGLAAIIGGPIVAYINFKEATSKEPQIIINNKGIATKYAGFREWKDVKHEEVIRMRISKGISYYLTFQYPGGCEHLEIDDFNTDIDKLNKLLEIYRGRSVRR